MPAIVTRHWERSTGIEHGNRLGFLASRGLLPRFSSFFAYSSHSLSSVAGFCRHRGAPVDTIDTPHCSRALATIILSFFRANCVFPRPPGQASPFSHHAALLPILVGRGLLLLFSRIRAFVTKLPSLSVLFFWFFRHFS